MTQEQINELRKLAQAATPGPWYAEGGTINKDVIYVYSEHSDFEVCHGDTSDSDYIAAANPAAILALIQQRDELLSALKDARELVDDWGAYAPAYMQEKHDLAGDLDRLYSVIAKCEAQS